MRLKESRRVPMWNGPIECRLFRFDLVAGSARGRVYMRQAPAMKKPDRKERDMNTTTSLRRALWLLCPLLVGWLVPAQAAQRPDHAAARAPTVWFTVAGDPAEPAQDTVQVDPVAIRSRRRSQDHEPARQSRPGCARTGKACPTARTSRK